MGDVVQAVSHESKDQTPALVTVIEEPHLVDGRWVARVRWPGANWEEPIAVDTMVTKEELKGSAMTTRSGHVCAKSNSLPREQQQQQQQEEEVD